MVGKYCNDEILQKCRNLKFHLSHDGLIDRRIKNAIPYLIRFPK